jgi:hypothetical protein
MIYQGTDIRDTDIPIFIKLPEIAEKRVFNAVFFNNSFSFQVSRSNPLVGSIPDLKVIENAMLKGRRCAAELTGNVDDYALGIVLDEREVDENGEKKTTPALEILWHGAFDVHVTKWHTELVLATAVDCSGEGNYLAPLQRFVKADFERLLGALRAKFMSPVNSASLLLQAPSNTPEELLMENLGLGETESALVVEILLGCIRKHEDMGIWRKPLHKQDTPSSLSDCTDKHKRRWRNRPIENQVDPLFELAKQETRLDVCFTNPVFRRSDSVYFVQCIKWVMLKWEERSQKNWLHRNRRELALANMPTHTYWNERYLFHLVLWRLGIDLPLEARKLVCSYLPISFVGGLVWAHVRTAYDSWLDKYFKQGLVLRPVQDGPNEYFYYEELEDKVWTSHDYYLKVFTGHWHTNVDNTVTFIPRQARLFKNTKPIEDASSPEAVVEVPVSNESDGKPWRQEKTAPMTYNRALGGVQLSGVPDFNMLIASNWAEAEPRKNLTNFNFSDTPSSQDFVTILSFTPKGSSKHALELKRLTSPDLLWRSGLQLYRKSDPSSGKHISSLGEIPLGGTWVTETGIEVQRESETAVRIVCTGVDRLMDAPLGIFKPPGTRLY